MEEVDNDPWGLGYKIVTKKLCSKNPLGLTTKEKLDIANELFVKDEEMKHVELETMTTKQQITTKEIKEAGTKLKIGKAGGIDGIPQDVVRLAAVNFPEMFLDPFNKMINEGNIPEEWKTSKLILIEKPNKTNDKVKKYRPLCLLNAVSKLWEQIINKRLTEEIKEKIGGLANNQYGFREGRSTIDAAQRIYKIAKETQQNKKRTFALLVTIDVKNAFNTAKWKFIIRELESWKVSPYLLNQIKQYLNNRKIMVEEETNAHIGMSCGVPQGSVLGPTLWNIYYNPLLKKKLPKYLELIGYADDLALIVEGCTHIQLKTRAEYGIEIIRKWFDEVGLQNTDGKGKNRGTYINRQTNNKKHQYYNRQRHSYTQHKQNKVPRNMVWEESKYGGAHHRMHK